MSEHWLKNGEAEECVVQGYRLGDVVCRNSCDGSGGVINTRPAVIASALVLGPPFIESDLSFVAPYWIQLIRSVLLCVISSAIR